jgi:hypothetical protein
MLSAVYVFTNVGDQHQHQPSLGTDFVNGACTAGIDTNALVKYGALSADIVAEEAIDMVLHNTYVDKDNLWKVSTARSHMSNGHT